MEMPLVICSECGKQAKLEDVLTAQSNQNVIYTCPACHCIIRDIPTSKG